MMPVSRRLSVCATLTLLLALGHGTPTPVAASLSTMSAAVAATAPGPTFLRDGAHLAPGVTLRLAALGRGDVLAPVDPVNPTDDGTRVEYAHGDVHATEWYRRQDAGIEQGITLATPPAGDGPLTLTIATPDLLPLVEADGGAATLILPHASSNSAQWRYDGLHVTDATGRVLPAHLTQAAGGGIGITVADAGAVYPVTVDPFMQTQTLAVNATLYFGYTVSLSGDGSTALVGASGTNGTAGTVYVFTRGNAGYVQFGPALAVSGTGFFGVSVSLSTNGDTALVGAYGTSSNVGTAHVYTCGVSGYMQFGPTLAVSGTQQFGYAVSLSTDGSIALVGALHATNSFVGAAYVYTRGAGGYTQFGPTLAASGTGFFGTSVALSGDGSAALVGAYGTNSNAGTAYMFTNRTLTGFSPPTGPTAGGTTVTVRGFNVTGTTAVTFDGVAGTNIFVNTDGKSLIVTAPAHAAGTVDIVVTANGQTATIHGYTYLDAGGIAPQPTPPHATTVTGAGGVPTPQPTRHSAAPPAIGTPQAQPGRH